MSRGTADGIARLSIGQGPDFPPSAPAKVGECNHGIVLMDIKQKFTDAVTALEPGDIVKDGYFTLFEAVAALEIMDPKMDSGVEDPGEELSDLYDVSRLLSPAEALGVMDQLICHEMSWHLGYPLSQTLFTSVYVEALLMPNPSNISEAEFVRPRSLEKNKNPMLEVLRIYCLGMLKACELVNEQVRSEHFYEEEDFVTNTYSRTLLRDVAISEVNSALLDAEESLSRQRESFPGSVMDGLLARLRLRRHFLAAAEKPKDLKRPDTTREAWKSCIELLPTIEATHDLGTAVEEAFSAKLQRKLASTMPPRPIVELNFQDAFAHLGRLFRDGHQSLEVLDYTDTQCLINFVTAFQTKKPQPLVFVRTFLQYFLFNSMEILGSMSIRQVLDDDLSIITMPASQLLNRDNDEIEAVHDARFVMSQQMEYFREKAAQPFLDVLRTLCQNRCRVRRTLYHVVQSWDALQVDADQIDHLLQSETKEEPMYESGFRGESPIQRYSIPLSSWAYLYKLKQMELIIQTGFELEVYQADELAGMYWYLNYLAQFRMQHVERIQMFALRTEKQTWTPNLDNSQSIAYKQIRRSLNFLRLENSNATATWELSDALCCLYIVLRRHSLVKSPPRPYSSDRLRYDVRMKPLALIGLPALPTFEEFSEGVEQLDTQSEELLEYAAEKLSAAKQGFDFMGKMNAEESFSVGSHDTWRNNMKRNAKACIALGIALSTLQSIVRGEIDVKTSGVTVVVPKPDEAYHEWWIVPRIAIGK